MVLADVRVIRLSRLVLRDTGELLRTSSETGDEAIALWAGTFGPGHDVFSIAGVILPAQRAARTEHGLLASVDGDELFRINKALSENNLRLIAQLHTHPAEAYHSETDDSYPLLSALGSLSIVIPNFARDEFALDRCALYRLEAHARWRELSQVEVRDLFQLTDD